MNQALAAGVLPDLTPWHPAIGDLLERAGGSGPSPVGELIKRATGGPVGLTDEQVSAAVHPYALLLHTVGAELELTAAGYLPPKVVAAIFAELALDRLWIGKGNREDATLPVLALRESAVSLGLLRKSRGTLLATKVGQRLADDPRGLWRHIASRLPLGRPEERDAGLLALLSTAAGSSAGGGSAGVGSDRYGSAGLVVSLLEYLGWGVVQGEMRYAAISWARPTMNVLDLLTGWRGDSAVRAAVAKELLRRAPG